MSELVAESRGERWSLSTRAAFRFAFCYYLIDQFPFPLTVIPGVGTLFHWYSDACDALYGWMGRTVLGLPGFAMSPAFNGSGDRLQDWVVIASELLLAVVGMLIWTAVDRRRPNYRKLYRLLRVYVRYILAFALLTYGTVKLIKNQMPSSLGRMLEPYGQSSPMALLWTFMGESTPYEMFAGACETLGGLLLLWRRTATLGALIGAGVMANVVFLNFAYDVPVKIYSMTLFLSAVFLVLDDAERLLNVLVLNRPTAPVELGPDLRRRWQRVARWIAKPALIGWFLYTNLSGNLERYYTSSDGAPTPELYGIFEVVEFSRDGKVVPPTLDEPSRWKRVAFDKGTGSLVRMDDLFTFMGARQDAKAHTVDVRMRDVPAGRLVYELGSNGEVVLSGFADRGVLRMRLRPSDPRHDLLQTRGFHWVNESPFNR